LLKESVPAARIGGHIILTDDDHDVSRLHPKVPGFGELWDTCVCAYIELGNDWVAGRKTVSFLHATGATPVRNTCIFFGSCAGWERFKVFATNVAGVLARAKAQMVQHNLSEEKKLDQIVGSFRDWYLRRDAASWCAVAWAEGRTEE
jgi:hypothetical protein